MIAPYRAKFARAIDALVAVLHRLEYFDRSHVSEEEFRAALNRSNEPHVEAWRYLSDIDETGYYDQVIDQTKVARRDLQRAFVDLNRAERAALSALHLQS